MDSTTSDAAATPAANDPAADQPTVAPNPINSVGTDASPSASQDVPVSVNVTSPTPAAAEPTPPAPAPEAAPAAPANDATSIPITVQPAAPVVAESPAPAPEVAQPAATSDAEQSAPEAVQSAAEPVAEPALQPSVDTTPAMPQPLPASDVPASLVVPEPETTSAPDMPAPIVAEDPAKDAEAPVEATSATSEPVADPTPEPVVEPVVEPAARPATGMGNVDSISATPVLDVPVSTPQPVMPEPTPEAVAEPLASAVNPETDSLFDPVEEPEAPIAPIAPPPAAPVTNETMQRLDDGPGPVVTAQGQAVAPAKAPHKRSKMMLVILLGLVVLGGIGYGAYAYLKSRVAPAANVPAVIASKPVSQLTPDKLAQATSAADLPAASQTKETTLLFSAAKPTDAETTVSLQVEVQPLGTAFTGTPSTSTAVTNDAVVQVSVAGLKEGSYHWQARFTDGSSNGPWASFNTTDGGTTADFTIDSAAPAAATITTVNGKSVSTKTYTSTLAQPTFAGKAEAGATVTVKLSDSISFKATADTNGAWSAQAASAVPNGRYSGTVVVTDAAGNASPALSFTLTESGQ